MPKHRVTAREFQSRPGLYQAMAREAPIVITNHGRDEFVLMTKSSYDRLKSMDTRTAHRVEDLPTEALQEILTSLMNYDSGDPVLEELYEEEMRKEAKLSASE